MLPLQPPLDCNIINTHPKVINFTLVLSLTLSLFYAKNPKMVD